MYVNIKKPKIKLRYGLWLCWAILFSRPIRSLNVLSRTESLRFWIPCKVFYEIQLIVDITIISEILSYIVIFFILWLLFDICLFYFYPDYPLQILMQFGCQHHFLLLILVWGVVKEFYSTNNGYKRCDIKITYIL